MINKSVTAKSVGLVQTKSVIEFQKDSIIMKRREKRKQEVIATMDEEMIEENLKNEFRRRRTLHLKIDPTVPRHSITTAWDKLIRKNQEKDIFDKKVKKRHLKKEHTIKNKRFVNGSTWNGGWSAIGMTGKGQYKFFHGIIIVTLFQMVFLPSKICATHMKPRVTYQTFAGFR